VNFLPVFGAIITYIRAAIATRIAMPRMMVSNRSILFSAFGIDIVNDIVSLSEGLVFVHRYHPSRPTMMIKPNSESRIGSSRIPHGVKLRMRPMSGTTAIDRPKLRAIRSILSMPYSVFFMGNNTKIRT